MKTVAVLSQGGGASPDAKSGLGYPAVVLAARAGQTAAVVALARGGADLEAPDPGDHTALRAAARAGHAGTVRALLACGAQPNAADQDGTTALMAAAREGHAEAVHALLVGGAAVDAADSHGETALIKAARNGEATCAQLLVEARASLAARGSWVGTAKKTAQEWAEEGDFTELAAFLADPSDKQRQEALAQHILDEKLYVAARDGDAEELGRLAARGASPDAKLRGDPAVCLAAAGGHGAAVTALVGLVSLTVAAGNLGCVFQRSQAMILVTGG